MGWYRLGSFLARGDSARRSVGSCFQLCRQGDGSLTAPVAPPVATAAGGSAPPVSGSVAGGVAQDEYCCTVSGARMVPGVCACGALACRDLLVTCVASGIHGGR